MLEPYGLMEANMAKLKLGSIADDEPVKEGVGIASQPSSWSFAL
jgi:hypothetical protein